MRVTSRRVPQRTDRHAARRGNEASRAARVKRWGKSPPRFRQRKWHGKPHPEQGQLGRRCWRRKALSERTARPMPLGRPLEACGNVRPRGMTASAAGRPSDATELGLRLLRPRGPPATRGLVLLCVPKPRVSGSRDRSRPAGRRPSWAMRDDGRFARRRAPRRTRSSCVPPRGCARRGVVPR